MDDKNRQEPVFKKRRVHMHATLALREAAERKDYPESEICKALTDGGPFALVLPDRYGYTPLHYAAECGNYRCLKLMLEAGADSSIPVKGSARRERYLQGRTSFRVAISETASFGRLRYMTGKTALHLAAEYNHVDCVKELIRFGANYNAVDIKGNTPLHSAVKYRKLECVKELVRAGCDVTCINRNGFSPLHLLFDFLTSEESIQMEILKVLVLEGYNTDVNQMTSLGETVLNLSKPSARTERKMIFLLKYGADLSIDSTLLKGELLSCKENNFLNYLIKCMPQLPRLKSLNLNLKIVEHDEGVFDDDAISHDFILPDDVEFSLVRTDSQVYVEIYDNEDNHIRLTRSDNALLRYRNVPFPVRYLLQQPLLNLVYERVVKQINSGKIREGSMFRLKQQLWYERIASVPRTLQHFCRFSVRKYMGPSNLKRIGKLPLPEKLLSYLMFESDK